MSKPKIYLKRRSYEEDGQLYLYYSYGGQKRLEFYTGFRVKNDCYNDQYWLGNKKPINKKHPYHESFNKLFEEMEHYAVGLVVGERIFDNAELKKRLADEFKASKIEEPVVDDFVKNDFISYCTFIQSERKQGKRSIVNGNRQGLNYKPNSLKNPSTTIASLIEFAKHKGKKTFLFNEIDVKFYNEYRDYLLNEKKQKVSTFSTRVRDIKAFMHEAMEDKVHDNTEFKNKRFIAPKYESTGIALTLDEIKKIKEAELPPEWDHVRDLFLIACYSALRFSDFSKLEITDMKDGFIRIKQDKTENRVSIPIMKDMKEVLAKYGGKLPPSCTNQHFNRTIKKICASPSVGLDRVFEVDKSGQKVMWSSKITSHTGRRSYATNMFKLGVPTLLIMSATGHKKEEMFLRYIKATNEEKSRLLADWMKKLGI